MADLSNDIEAAVSKLLEAEEGQLYEQLGLRSKNIARDPATAGSFEPHIVYDEAEMGLKDDIQKLGKRLFHRWNIEANKLVCGSDADDKKDRESLMSSFGMGEVAVTAALCGLLVTSLGLAPAIAAVVAALAIKRFFRPAYEEFCAVWSENIQETD